MTVLLKAARALHLWQGIVTVYRLPVALIVVFTQPEPLLARALVVQESNIALT